MKGGSTLFLKVIIVFIAIAALAAMIRFPQTEGRAAGLDLISIYKDPFIIYAYVASISFFMALFQAIKVLGLVEKNKIFSQAAVKAVRNIKYCATALVAFVAAPLAYLVIALRGKDDIAGGVAGGLFLIFVSVVIATAAAVFQKILQNAVDLKSANKITV
jgi:hypothetical protein